MTFRFCGIFAAAFVLLAAVPAAAAGLPLAKKTMAFKAKDYEISITYPQTGNRAIDAVLLDYAKKQADQFKGYEKARTADDTGDYYLDVGYTVERNDGQMFGLVFGEDMFTGGAHPNHDYATFNFLLPDGAQVFLPEILDGENGLDRLSRIVTAKLIKEIGTGTEAVSDADTIKMGTAPAADNFKNFIILPAKLHLYFPPYQVASYAAGPQETTVDLNAMKDVVRTDWRAPAPSFDCRKAATPIEKAICADASLARLDRQTAETYQTALRNAYEPGAQQKLRQAQRDWLAARNRRCGGPSPGPCLTKLYRDRLAFLGKPPA